MAGQSDRASARSRSTTTSRARPGFGWHPIICACSGKRGRGGQGKLVKHLVVFVSLVLTSCGYNFAATDTALPKTIQTIPVPAFTNLTIRYKLTDQLPEAIAQEFLTRTRYKIVSDPNTADASCTAPWSTILLTPPSSIRPTGRAAYAELYVTVSVTLNQRATGKVLFDRKNFDLRETYQISPNATQYFEESDPALKRAGQQVARSVISAVPEVFE